MSLRCLGCRRHIPAQYRRIVDLILAFNVAYFLGAMFEWHIVSRMEGNISYMLIFSVMTKGIIDKVNAETSARDLYAQEADYYGAEEPDLHTSPG